MADKTVASYFKDPVSRDLLRLVCGDVLGEGISRTVYSCIIRPDLVVKVETRSQSFQNAMEWELWSSVAECKKFSEWLAPCEFISQCGTILMMKRTEPIRPSEQPAKLPMFLTDVKAENYGLLNGHVVCHDYGYIRLLHGSSSRTRKVHWD